MLVSSVGLREGLLDKDCFSLYVHSVGPRPLTRTIKLLTSHQQLADTLDEVSRPVKLQRTDNVCAEVAVAPRNNPDLNVLLITRFKLAMVVTVR